MSDDVLKLQREHAARMCDALARMNAPLLPAWQAAASGRIALMQIDNPAASWPKATIERFRLPSLVIVGDDPPDEAALGPDGWQCARALKYWCRGAIIHGAAGLPEHYRAAVGDAERFKRVALIETSSARAAEWGNFLNSCAIGFILPRTGPHPVAPDRSAVH